MAIRHRTGYAYSGEVTSSYNEARVTPLTIPSQLVVEAEVRVQPAAPTFRYWDYWGSMVHAFDVHVPHTELCVTGSSVVDTSPSQSPAGISWQELGESPARDRLAELVAPTTYVPRDAEISEEAEALARAKSPVEACERATGCEAGSATRRTSPTSPLRPWRRSAWRQGCARTSPTC